MREKNSREAILKCALELFSQKGYEAVSPNEIAEKAGITKPTLYYFFGSKEGLFDEILKTNYAKLDSLMEECCKYVPNVERYHEDVYPVLMRIVNAVFGFAKDNPEFYLMSLAMGFSPPSSKTAAVSEKYAENHRSLLERAFRDISAAHGNLKGKERIGASCFLAVTNARIGFWFRGHGRLDAKTAHSVVAGFMHGIFS